MTRSISEMMDSGGPSPLTDVLRGVRLSQSFYCESTLTAPWGFQNPRYPIALFHFVLRGGSWLRMESRDPILLRAGDMVLIPHGHAHSLSDTPRGPVVGVETIARTQLGENTSCMSLGGGGDETFLICGGMHFEPTWHPLVTSLPPVIVVRHRDACPDHWLGPLFRLLRAEAGAGRPGGEAMITRLAEVLVVASLREWVETATIPATGWLVAVRHREIGRAIGAIHGSPHHPWTLAALASKAGMSRSVFTEQFSSLCGMPPVQYVTHCRMNVAGDWLKQTKIPIAEVADRLGYSSEATFSRAFKRNWGIPPGRFRKAPLPTRQFVGPSFS